MKKDQTGVSEIKKRGRQKGQTNMLSMIKDPLLEPFQVKIEENQFVLVKNDAKGKEEVYGYYSKLSYCLLKVAEIKTPNQPTFTLSEYVERYKDVSNELLAKVTI